MVRNRSAVRIRTTAQRKNTTIDFVVFFYSGVLGVAIEEFNLKYRLILFLIRASLRELVCNRFQNVSHSHKCSIYRNLFFNTKSKDSPLASLINWLNVFFIWYFWYIISKDCPLQVIFLLKLKLYWVGWSPRFNLLNKSFSFTSTFFQGIMNL